MRAIRTSADLAIKGTAPAFGDIALPTHARDSGAMRRTTDVNGMRP